MSATHTAPAERRVAAPSPSTLAARRRISHPDVPVILSRRYLDYVLGRATRPTIAAVTR